MAKTVADDDECGGDCKHKELTGRTLNNDRWHRAGFSLAGLPQLLHSSQGGRGLE